MNSSSQLIHAAIGGCLIGLGSLLALVTTGKIPGISGMLSGILRHSAGDTAWRIIFLLALVAGACITFRTVDAAAVFQPIGSPLVIAIAGVLVGFGTRLSGGCTSGHGVCGIGMGSRSAFIATLVFISGGIVTVGVVHYLGSFSFR